MKLANTGEADDVVVARAVGVPRVTAIEEECLLGVAAIVAQFDKFVKFDNVVEGGEGEGEGDEGEGEEEGEGEGGEGEEGEEGEEGDEGDEKGGEAEAEAEDGDGEVLERSGGIDFKSAT